MDLYKTEIVIWSDYNPEHMEIEELAREAIWGGSYCSKQKTYFVLNAEEDEEWDDTEFFYDYEGEE